MENNQGKNNKWNVQKRLTYIDYRLKWFGRFNRLDLVDKFGISIPQASLDISQYISLAPNNIEYNRSMRVYLKKSSFQSIYPEINSASSFLSHLLSSKEDISPYSNIISSIPSLARSMDDVIAEKLILAIQTRSQLQIRYQSLNSRDPSTRIIFPKSLVFDGLRWHVRAFCLQKKLFLDFIIARIISAEECSEEISAIPEDYDWNKTVTLIIEPHSDLTESQKLIIERDFHMNNHQLKVECKKAHLFYLLKNYRLLDPWVDPQLQVIELKNASEVRKYLTPRELSMLTNNK